MNPAIPNASCFFCGKPTIETQSVFGVGHDGCFRISRLPATCQPGLPHNPMDQFFHSRPPAGMKGVRALYCLQNGKAEYMVWLPDQVT